MSTGEKKKITSKTESILSVFFFFERKCVFQHSVFFFLNGLQLLSASQMELINVVFKLHGYSLTMCFMGGYRDPARTIMTSIRSFQRSVQGTYYCMVDWHQPDSVQPSHCILILQWALTVYCIETDWIKICLIIGIRS